MSRTRHVLAAVGAALLLFLTLGAWSLSSPVGSSPDDDFHLASIWCGQGERDGLCEAGSAENTRLVPDKAVSAACFVGKPSASAACQGSEFLDSGFTLVETARLNSGSQYPPGYYLVASAFAGDNVALSTIGIRLFNSAIFSALFVATWVALPRRFRFMLSASVAVTFAPLAAFTIASVNPSSWSISAGFLTFPAILGFFATTGRRKLALGALGTVSALLAIASRGDSAAYTVVAILAAAVLSFKTTKEFWLTFLTVPQVLLVLSIAAFFLTGQTGLALSGDMGDGSLTASGVEIDEVPPTADILTILNLLSLPALWTGVFGNNWGIGWLDTSLPAVVPAAGMFLFAGLIFLATAYLTWRKVLALLGIGFAAVAVPTIILVQAYSLVGSHVQPRYILPLISMFLAAALAPSLDTSGTWKALPSLGLTQLCVVALGAVGANAISLFSNLRRYVTDGSYYLDTQTAWWWVTGPSPFGVLAVGSLAFALLMTLFVLAHRAPTGTPPRIDAHAP